MRSVASQQPGLSDVPPIAHPVGLDIVVAATDGAIIVGAPTGAVLG
jgi:hypothetical protein